MCYEVVLSLDEAIDLTGLNAEGLTFSRDLPESGFLDCLIHPYRWHIGSHAGCSCGFRHSTHSESGFGPPEPWCPEEPEDIRGTLAFIRVVRQLLAAGHRVDCVCFWFNGNPCEGKHLDVDLGLVQDEAFRFFENHHFSFTRPEIA